MSRRTRVRVPATSEVVPPDLPMDVLDAVEGEAYALPIPEYLMVLAARGEVTMRVCVNLEEDAATKALDDTASGH